PKERNAVIITDTALAQTIIPKDSLGRYSDMSRKKSMLSTCTAMACKPDEKKLFRRLFLNRIESWKQWQNYYIKTLFLSACLKIGGNRSFKFCPYACWRLQFLCPISL